MITLLVDAIVWGAFIGATANGFACSIVAMVWVWRFFQTGYHRTWLAVLALIPTQFLTMLGGWIIVDFLLLVRFIIYLSDRRRRRMSVAQ